MSALPNARTISLASLNDSMPAALRPVESLHDALRNEASPLVWTRISAFSRFATSVDDLVEWIDDASEDTLEGYRARFRLFLASLARAEKCYAYLPRAGRRDTAIVCDEAVAQAIAPAISENAEADLFVPARAIALLGHDDFGCNLVYQGGADRQWLEQLATDAGLYSVRP